MKSISAPVGPNQRNLHGDVVVVQNLLNYKVSELALPRLVPDGRAGELLFRAIVQFQGQFGRFQRPDGVIDPGKKTIKLLNQLTVSQRAVLDKDWIIPDAPKWIQKAGNELGTFEYKGINDNNPQVLKYIATVPALQKINYSDKHQVKMSTVDESAWCGCFVNWCLKQAGLPGNDTIDAGRARKWVGLGTPLTPPKYGCVTVVYKKGDGHHVGFYVGERAGAVVLLGGNQEHRHRLIQETKHKIGGRVCVTAFPGWTVKGNVWPKGGGAVPE